MTFSGEKMTFDVTEEKGAISGRAAGETDEATNSEPASNALLELSSDLARSINYRIRMAQILSFRRFEKNRPGYGGAARFLGLLSIVRANPGEPQHRIAETVGLQRSSVVPILDKMEANGIIERQSAASDRRAKTVWLTEKGETVLDELIEPANELEARMLRGFSQEEIDQLLTGLDRIVENLRRE